MQQQRSTMIFDNYLKFTAEDFRCEYFGGVKRDIMHGYGKLVLKNGKSFQGKWKDGECKEIAKDLFEEEKLWSEQQKQLEEQRKENLTKMKDEKEEEMLFYLRDTDEATWL